MASQDHGQITDAISNLPSWAPAVGAWIGGMISTVALALFKRGESINQTIDKRMQMWFEERDRERAYFVARVKALETENAELHEKITKHSCRFDD